MEQQMYVCTYQTIYINVAAGILCTPSVANLWVQGCLTTIYCDTIDLRVYLYTVTQQQDHSSHLVLQVRQLHK